MEETDSGNCLTVVQHQPDNNEWNNDMVAGKSVHPHMDHLSPAAGQNLLRTTGGYSVKDRLHVVSMAPGNCRISWSSNNMISQKERKPSLLQQPYPSLRRFELALLR
ncbi:uncharacterized protein AAG666_013313 isoform 4-T4 [Megaptera novaeangliae]